MRHAKFFRTLNPAGTRANGILTVPNFCELKSRTTREVDAAIFALAKLCGAINYSRAAIPRSSSAGTRAGSASRRSHRHGDIVDLRRASALRFAAERTRISAAHHEKAAHQIDH